MRLTIESGELAGVKIHTGSSNKSDERTHLISPRKACKNVLSVGAIGMNRKEGTATHTNSLYNNPCFQHHSTLLDPTMFDVAKDVCTMK